MKLVTFLLCIYLLVSGSVSSAKETDENSVGSNRMLKPQIHLINEMSGEITKKLDTELNDVKELSDNGQEAHNRLVLEQIEITKNSFYVLNFEVTIFETNYTNLYLRIDLEYGSGIFLRSPAFRQPADPIDDAVINGSSYELVSTADEIVRFTSDTNIPPIGDDDAHSVKLVLKLTPGFVADPLIKINYTLRHYQYDLVPTDLLRTGGAVEIPRYPLMNDTIDIDESSLFPEQVDQIILTPPSLLPKYLPFDFKGREVTNYNVIIHVEMRLMRESYSTFYTIDILAQGTKSFTEDRATFSNKSEMNATLSTPISDRYDINFGNRGNDVTLSNIKIWIEYPNVLNNPFAQLSLIQQNLNFILGITTLTLVLIGYQLVKLYDHKLLVSLIEKNEKVVLEVEE
ncbi:MAG: hypothetical protein IH840_12890 [Candidatus Heimdallarchaeota archaeon]|nr:hypothetical protein [Candidatus Heimdallarchaeota archaeon]